MDLVIDANILFAALIKQGTTSDIIFKHTLYAPEFIFLEFKEHKEEIKEKTKRSEEGFNELLELFERNIILVPKEEIGPFMKKANKISPDPDDAYYVALAMKLKCPIWSNDKELKKKQNEIKVYSTEELVRLFE